MQKTDARCALDALYAAHAVELATLSLSGELRRPVFGEGPLRPLLMLVGEAPGAEETEQGHPFVGKAGKQLNAFLSGAGLEREEIFVTNAVKYRPFREHPQTKRKANRTPGKDELLRGKALLQEEIRLISPRVVATLGNSPLFSVLGDELRGSTIGQLHGREMTLPLGTILFPLYHPASVIYNRELVAVYERDVRALRIVIERETQLFGAQLQLTPENFDDADNL